MVPKWRSSVDRPLCCFIDPEYSDEPKDLTDVCPRCNKPYGFPLFDAPAEIGPFKVVKSLNRGFYSAVFHVTHGSLDAPYVLKVASKAIYEAFADYGKDFEKECRLHREIAAGSDHLVPIRDMFDADIRFGDVTVPCHVAQLDYVPGEPLEQVLAAEPPPAARTVAQLALDLLQLLEELQAREAFHNDLHDGNVIVERLSKTSRRAEALDDSIRAVAIDMGSITDRSKSGTSRLGDLASVARHLESFSRRLLSRPHETSDIDYRLAGQLAEIAALLASDAVNQRPAEFAVLRDRIRQAHDFVASPWKQPPPLRSIDDSYNAQTLHPWFVPKLLVDPEGHWRNAISVRGPQVITGMRGCGKTMLLRSLMFHARAAEIQSEREDLLVDKLQQDGYVGLYVSCNRLLDPLGSTGQLHQPDARLFVAYVREALRAVRHLRELDRSLPVPGAVRRIGEVLHDYVGAVDQPDTDDELVLERLTLRILASLQRSDEGHGLLTDPSAAFVALADAVKAVSSVWAGATVFYLLDDVSTRHLDEDSIRALVSRLIFLSDICAFKMTTEQQTLEYVLKSPGLVEKARPGRDYEVFEFGSAVYERIREPLRKGGGTNFIRDVLALRAAQYPAHPDNVTPADLLGNERLETIAQQLAVLPPAAAERKRIYRGLRALTAVCVGDIGDVLAIYESMFRRGGGERVPIAPEIQHQCFLDYCSQRLYHINHRDGRFKDAALGFAQAARDLLVASARGEGRLRQYSSLYVRVTTEDTERQFEQLRTLIDAGVFILEGGAPRTKTRDDDPVQQFILKYRKLFGLASHIGLSDRDRFELSGEDLREWLEEPKRGREILMRNLGGPLEEGDEAEPSLEDGMKTAVEQVEDSPRPQTLFETLPAKSTEEPDTVSRADLALKRAPTAAEVSTQHLRDAGIRSVVVGLGFEERTRMSAERMFSVLKPETAVLVRYAERGFGAEIEALAEAGAEEVMVFDYDALGPTAEELPPGGPCLIDITGLTKPVIFQCVRRALGRDGVVYVAHTQAEQHYPLDESIEPVLEAEKDGDVWTVLDRLDDVWSGEAGPYTFEQILMTDADESRRRHLFASASPKHQRLLSLVEQREFDRMEILVPSGEAPRDMLARKAAEVARGLVEDSEIREVGSDDLSGALQEISRTHQRFYVDGNFNFEVGLTGSKLHAVALAAASSTTLFSQAWYVRPASFDATRFSLGVGETRYFEVRIALPDR